MAGPISEAQEMIGAICWMLVICFLVGASFGMMLAGFYLIPHLVGLW